MACGRCKDRADAIRRGASAIVRGDIKTAAQSAGLVARTMSQDARSGALRAAALQRLATLRQRPR